MQFLSRLFRKLSFLLRRERFNDDLAEEMSFHHEQAAKRLQADGISSESAQYAAMRQFGNATRLKEQSEEIVGFGFENAAQDVRYAFRQLRTNPAFATTAILVLALGICASVAIFAFVDAALIQPLPYPNPTRLVAVTESVPLFPRADLSYLDYLDWKRLNKVFSSMAVHTGRSYMLGTPAGTELVAGTIVSDGFFRTLGIVPALGRDFYPGEDLPEAPNTAIITFATWQKRFGGRKDVIGQTVTLSGITTTIIGVLPENFQFAPRGRAEFWGTLHASEGCELRRSCHNLDGVGRLKNGVSVQAAAADMSLIARELEAQYPDSNRGQGASVLPLSEVIGGDIRPILLLLLGGASLLLAIASLNVSSLLLVRSESRKREIAVRGALGASPARLIRQFVTEGLVLVLASSALGLLSAEWAMRLLLTLIPTDMSAGMPYLRALGLNFHVLAFAAVISALAAVLFSITPTVRLRLGELREGLTEGSRGSAGTMWRTFGSKLVALELAIAMVLLVGAGLLGKSLNRLLRVDLQFQPDHLATIEVAVPKLSYRTDEQQVTIARQIVSRVSSLPGVKSAATTMQPPVRSNGNTDWIRFVGRPYDGKHNEVNQRDVSAGYFATLQAKLLQGRYFTDAEDASKPGVVIVNQALARQYFPGEDPLGKKIGDTELSPKSIREIIGVVADIKEGSLDSEIWPAVYYPFNQSPDTYFTLMVRTSQAEESVLPLLGPAIHQVDPDLGTKGEATMNQRINDSPSAYLHRSSAWLVGGFAGLALLLGVVGLYGVIAYSVSQRTREIGVRMALGAERSSVYQLVLKEAGGLTALGIALGLLCSVLAGTLMRKLLFGTHPWDLLTLLAVSGILGISAMLASFLPARRAASVNPVEALRTE
jgi:predicted permease